MLPDMRRRGTCIWPLFRNDTLATRGLLLTIVFKHQNALMKQNNIKWCGTDKQWERLERSMRLCRCLNNRFSMATMLAMHCSERSNANRHKDRKSIKLSFRSKWNHKWKKFFSKLKQKVTPMMFSIWHQHQQICDWQHLLQLELANQMVQYQPYTIHISKNFKKKKTENRTQQPTKFPTN